MWRYAYPGSSDDTKPRVTWANVRRVLAYARPHRTAIVFVLLLILVQSGVGLLTPLIFGDLVGYTLTDEVRDVARLNFFIVLLIAIPIVTSVLGVVIRRLNAGIGEGVIYELRRSLYAHLQNLSLRFFTNTKQGELMSRLNNDVVNAQTAISDTIVGTITNGVRLLATLAIMLTLEWRLTVLGLILFPVFFFIARRIGLQLRAIAREQMDINAQMNAMVGETLNINGALLVKLFGRQRAETDRFASRAARVRDIGVRRAVMGSQFWTIMGLIGVIGTALVYGVGGHLVLGNQLEIATLVALSLYLGQLYDPLEYLLNVPVEFSTSMVSFERVFEVIDLPLEIDEKPNARRLTGGEVRGALQFDRVTFRYDMSDRGLLEQVTRHGSIENVRAVLSGDDTGADTVAGENGVDARPKARAADGNGATGEENGEAARTQARDVALTDLTFEVRPGQLTALVGPSGAGKTTLTYLIPRLYDPTEGVIRLDGYDLRDLSLETLAEQVGMVTQETYLFHDTIRTNLLYARLNATDAEIVAAAKAANIHDFIMELPDGYDTVVGERGYRLSGGEKQRLAIARVVLKDPRILVLDEATSHLDSQSEALIQAALERIMVERTSIVIAHRLSTILAADQILVMDRGRIVERGTHDDLIAQGGLYASLYETQFSRQDAELLPA